MVQVLLRDKRKGYLDIDGGAGAKGDWRVDLNVFYASIGSLNGGTCLNLPN